MIRHHLVSCCLIFSGNKSIIKNWSRTDFNLTILSSTAVNITWNRSVDEDGSATILQITAHHLHASVFRKIEKVEGSSGFAHFHLLRPYTWYKFIVKKKQYDEVLAEIGPIRTWPSGNSHSVFANISKFSPPQTLISMLMKYGNNKPLQLLAPRVTNLNGHALSYHEIKLRWNNSKPASGELKPYEVNCHEVEGNAMVHVKTRKNLVIFKNLLPNTRYNCTLKASTYPEREQDPKECEVLVKSPQITTFDFGAYTYFCTPFLLFLLDFVDDCPLSVIIIYDKEYQKWF